MFYLLKSILFSLGQFDVLTQSIEQSVILFDISSNFYKYFQLHLVRNFTLSSSKPQLSILAYNYWALTQSDCSTLPLWSAS